MPAAERGRAALLNGTAAHGRLRRYGSRRPVHAAPSSCRQWLAACERHRPDGTAALTGIAVGIETMCRLGLVTPKLVTRPGFIRRRCSAPWRRRPGWRPLSTSIVAALSTRSHRRSMAAGTSISRRRAPGTKRMHAGWGGAIGMRAALDGKAWFHWPAHVFEGTHGLFHGFAHTAKGNYDDAARRRFRRRWAARRSLSNPTRVGR